MTDSYDEKNQKLVSDALNKIKRQQTLYTRIFTIETSSFWSTSN